MLLVSATGWRAAATPENYFLFFISFLLRKKKVIYFMNKNPTSDRRDDHFLWISDSNTVDETCLSVSLRMKSSQRQTCYLLQTAIMSSALSRGNWTCEHRAARRHAPSGPLQGKKTQLSPRWLLSMFPDFRLIPRENNLAGWNICVSSSERWPRHVEETFGSRSEYLARSEQLSLLEFSWQRRTASRYSAEIIHKIHFQIPPAARRESLS